MNLKSKFKILEKIINRPKDLTSSDPTNGDINDSLKADNYSKYYACHFENLFKNSANAICIIQDEIIFNANLQTSKIVGYPLEEIIGEKIHKFIHPDKVNNVLEIYKNTISRDKTTEKHETLLLCNNGEVKDVEFCLCKTELKNNVAVLAQLSDISKRKQLEKELIDTKDKLYRLAEEAPDMIIRLSLPDGKCEYVNPSSLKVCGYPPEYIYNTPFFIKDIIHPDWKDFLDKQMHNLLSGKLPSSFEYAIIDKSGQTRWLNQRNKIIYDSQRRPISLEAIINDITEKKEIELELDHYRKHLEDLVEEQTSELSKEIAKRIQTERELQKSEEKYKNIINSLIEGIGIVDENEIIEFCNPSYCKIFDIDSHDKLIGRNLLDFIPDDQKEIINEQSKLRKKNKSSQYSVDIITGKNNRKTILISASPRFNEQNEFKGTYGNIVDITEQVKKQEELQVLHQAFQQTMDEIAIADLEGNIIYVNSAWAHAHGYSRDELKGANISIFHTEQQLKEEVIPFNNKVLEYGKKIGEIGHVKKDGTTFPTYMTSSLVHDDNGHPRFLIGIARDITKTKGIELALRKSEEKYRMLIENVNAVVVLVDYNGKLVFVNTQGAKYFNKTATEITGCNIKDLFPAEIAERQLKNIRKAIDSNEILDLENITVINDKLLWFYNKIQPYKYIMGEDKLAMIITHDVTEKKQAELELRKSEEKLKAIISSIDDLIFVLNKEGIFIEYYKPTKDYILFLPPEKFLGKSYKDIFPEYLVELIDQAINDIDTSEKTQEFDYSLEINDREYWFNAKLSHYLDSNNKIIGYTALIRDITAKKKTEFSNIHLTNDLRERIKEINCLYSLNKIIHESDNLKHSLKKVVNIIPLGYQFPDTTCCRIELFNDTYYSTNFKESNCSQNSTIFLHGKPVGKIDVFVTNNIPGNNKPFLREEYELIESIAHTLEIEIEKETAYTQLEELTNKIVEIQENDRKSLVRELHDNIAQKLGVSKIILEKEIINSKDQDKKIFEKLSSNISDIASDLRNLANDIRPIILENFGLVEAVKFYMKQYKNDFNIEMKLSPEIVIDDWNIKINLYRCFQEIIYNVKKHSKAKKVSISLFINNNELVLKISDDGVGFDIKNLSDSNKKIMRFGLINITERVDLINGRVDLVSEPGKGTTFIITVPMIGK